MPRAEEHADLALGRQRAPVAPDAGPFAFLVRRLGKCAGDFNVARIHPFVEQVDGLALARRPRRRRSGSGRGKFAVLLEVVLRVEQRLAQLCFLGRVGGLADAVIEICGFEHKLQYLSQGSAPD